MKETDENKKGFHVPKDYFESLDTELMTRLKESSKNGLKVPDGYFEGFEVKPPLEYESSVRPNSRGVFKIHKPKVRNLIWLATAASVILFFGIKYMNTNQSALNWDDLEQADISSWIESDHAELNAYDIAEAYPDVELNTPNISNEELNAYLNEIELDQILYEN